jgi:hypothetical protein
MTPDTTGFFWFSGTRAVGNNNQFRRVHGPVEIVNVWNRRGYELAVKLIGRQQSIPLAAFSGDWQPLRLEVSA